MSTLTSTTSVNVNMRSDAKNQSKVKTQSAFWSDMEANRFAYTPMILVVMACIGGIAAAYGIQDSWIKIAIIAFPATFSLSTILAVMPMRVVVISAIIAIALDILVIAF